MRHANDHRKKNVGVLLQIAAMVMLLCAPYLPLLAGAASIHAQRGRCFMDHRLCGCSPERIASRTCCCFRNGMKSEGSVTSESCDVQTNAHAQCDLATEGPATSGCCDVQTKAHAQCDLDDADDLPSATPRLSSLPCGLDPQMISHAASELKYLRSTRGPLPAQLPAPHAPSPQGDTYQNPSLEPSVPPPKIFFFV